MQKNSSKYPVEFVDNPFDEGSPLADWVGEHKLLLVTDHNVVQHVADLGKNIGSYLKSHNLSLASSPVVLSGGERLKLEPYQSVFQVVNACLKADLGADDCVVALGGGTLLDAAGWAVSQVKGSPRLVRIPTTPAAMMDAAFASSASINTATVKDALTVASIPVGVLIAPMLAATVLDGVWRAGISEAVRLAAVHDIKLLKKFLPIVEAYARRDAAALDTVVRATVKLRLKKGTTNLGLKSAAEFEPKSVWKLPHGYAVSIGTLIELNTCVKAGEAEQQTFDDVRTILKQSGALDGLYHSRHILPPEVANFW